METLKEELLEEIRDHGAPTSSTGEVVDDCAPSPFKGEDVCGRYDDNSVEVYSDSEMECDCGGPEQLSLSCEIDVKGAIKAHHEGGRIVLRSKKWIRIEANEPQFVRTGMMLKGGDRVSDVSFHFMRMSHLGRIKDFDTEMLSHYSGECPTLIFFDKEIVLKIQNKTENPITIYPGECLGTIFAIKPIEECKLINE
jgi:hypothetical protein